MQSVNLGPFVQSPISTNPGLTLNKPIEFNLGPVVQSPISTNPGLTLNTYRVKLGPGCSKPD